MKQSAKLRAIGTALITLGAGMVISTTHAASPPDSWVNERIIECDGVEIQTFLGPPGFGTPFNIVGSSEVIIPKVVVVTFDGQTFTTRSVPGFDIDGPHVVECSYTDPVGAFIHFWGIRTGKP